MTPTKAKFKKTSQKDGLMLTALVGASAVSRALTAAAAMAAAFGIGVWELLTKSGIPGGVTAYNQSTDTRCSCCQKMANHLATTRLDAQTITTQWCVCVCVGTIPKCMHVCREQSLSSLFCMPVILHISSTIQAIPSHQPIQTGFGQVLRQISKSNLLLLRSILCRAPAHVIALF